MTNELTTVSQSDIDKLSDFLGSDVGGGEFIPYLKINYDDEDEQGRRLTKGHFAIATDNGPVYAETVKLRPMAQTFHYQRYDAAQDKVTTRTVQVADLAGAELLDTDGGQRCGKPPSKELKDNPALAKQFEDVTCFRNIYGLVTADAVDADGNQVKLENHPVQFRNKGSNFMPFEEEFKSLLRKGMRIWDFAADLTTSKEKQGKVIYFVVHYTPDMTDRLPITQADYDTLLLFKNSIEDYNAGVVEQYTKAVKSKTTDSEAKEIMSAFDDGEVIEGELVED